MKKLVVLLVLIPICIVSAQDAEDNFKKNMLGLSASLFSGIGISYQRELVKDWRIKTTGVVTYWEEDNYSEWFISYGAESQYDLIKMKETRFYAIFGASLMYWEDNDYYYILSEMTVVDESYEKTIERTFTVGPGFGLEILVLERVAINFDAGFVYYSENNNGFTNFRNRKGLMFAGGVGVGYRF